MSADNYFHVYTLDNVPGYHVGEGCASWEDRNWNEKTILESFDSFEEAVTWASAQWAEYGVSIQEGLNPGVEAYVRTTNGDCHMLPIKDAMENFLGEDGYRITLRVGNYEIVIRRDYEETGNEGEVAVLLGQNCVSAIVTVREKD